MQSHYDNVVESIRSLTHTIQASSLNREEFNNARMMLNDINEQTLPGTLTWVPKVEELVVEEPIQKKVARTFLTPFKEQLDKLRL